MSNKSYNDNAEIIWKALNLFRLYFSPDKYGLFLYLIHVYSTGLLKFYPESKTHISVAGAIDYALFHDDRNYPVYEHDLFNLYFHDLKAESREEAFHQLIECFRKLDTKWLNKNKANLFDDIIDHFIHNVGRYGEGLQLLELTKFISSVSSYDGHGVLYNPFAGSATYGTELAGDGKYFGQELNPITWSIGVMRLLAHGKSAFDFTRQNSISEWGTFDSDKSYNNYYFDCIVATPPFGIKIRPEEPYSNGYRRVEDFLISKCLTSLNPYGTAIVVLPQNAAFTGTNQSLELRKQLVLNDKLDTVIMLPSGAFCYSPIPAIILIISNNKNNPGSVRMVDGTKFADQTDRKRKVCYDELIEALNNADPDCVKLVSNTDINHNEFNILPSIYFKIKEQLPEGFETFKLSDVAEVYNGLRCPDSDAMGKVVKINLLSNDPFKCVLDLDSIPDEAINNQYRKITKSVLLVSKVRNLKPTLVNASERQPIYINSNILALKVNTDLIDVYCLIHALSQKTDLQVGSLIPNISQSFIMSLEVALPSNLDAQKAYYFSAERSYKMAQVKEYGLEEIIASHKKEFISILRRRKHDINTYVGDIRNRIQGLNKFLKRENIDKMIYSPRQNTTVGENLETIILKLNQMGQYLEHIADENNYGIPQKVDLCEKLKEIKNGPNYKVELIVDQATLALVNSVDNDELHAFVKIAPLDLDHILLNIITNAYKHGFTDQEAKDYRIEIFLVYNQEQDRFDIAIRNNGKPLPEGMNTERYGTPGEKAGLTQGNGEGGAIVKDTIEHYGGHLNVLSEPEGIFPVTILFYLPRYDEE